VLFKQMTPSVKSDLKIFMSDFPEPIYNDDLAVETAKPRLKRPPLYRVILLNDDYTTMEFVIEVLTIIFRHSEEKAAQIMMHVHQKGANKHPLQCTMEPDSGESSSDSEGE